jgi:hypothetical protein
MSKRIHVVPHESVWATRRERASRAGSTHPTQAEATEAGTQHRTSRARRSRHPPPERSYPGRQLVRQRPLPTERITAPLAIRPEG